MSTPQAPTPAVLRIGLPAELTEPLLAAFSAAEPTVRLAVRNVACGPHAELLAAGLLDAVIGPSPACEYRLTSVPLFANGRLVISSTQDPITGPTSSSRRTGYGRRPFGRSGYRGRHWTTSCRWPAWPRPDGGRLRAVRDGRRPADIARDRSYLTVTTATERSFKHPGVVYRPVSDTIPTVTSVITLPPAAREKRDGAIERFVSTAAAVASELAVLVPGAVPLPEQAAPQDVRNVLP